ncbi:MAG: hypothetical protein QOJ73_7644 [Streptosporangiaceae bacterium]|jgi:hypothetical protein|nr:hypothetical protein [Streptosporangiaceae bacterium]
MEYVPDVSLYVAAITAGAAVVGAGVSFIPVYLRDIRRADQDRRDRHADTRRQGCLDLLGAAEDLRTTVANAADYHGEEMPARLGQIRTYAAAVQIHAANIELLAPATFATPADVLAKAAGKFAVQAAANTDLKLNQMVAAPDPTELGEAIEVFRKQAVLDAAR